MKLLLLAAAAGTAWWLWRRRGSPAPAAASRTGRAFTGDATAPRPKYPPPQ